MTEAFNGNVHEGLFRLTDEGKAESLLAESQKVGADGLTCTFTLRDGVTFHSGDPLTSADVKHGIEQVTAKKPQSARRSAFAVVKSIETPDDGTVVVKLKDRSISFAYNLSHVWIVNDTAKDLAVPTAGRVLFDGTPLSPRDRGRMRAFRRSVQTVFQDPCSSLDPRQRVGRIVAEPLRSLGLVPAARWNASAADLHVAAALEAAGLPAGAARRYPHEFSGGQRQRVAIARAIVCEPRVLLADEPVSALDVSTRVRVIDLPAELRESHGLTVVMVSHDLAAVAVLCDHTAVLERGRIVEQDDTATVLGSPRHPYTRRLIGSVPRLPVT